MFILFLWVQWSDKIILALSTVEETYIPHFSSAEDHDLTLAFQRHNCCDRVKTYQILENERVVRTLCKLDDLAKFGVCIDHSLYVFPFISVMHP